jgi:hypothetical protein
MPLACPVEFHALKAVRMPATPKREPPPGKPVASRVTNPMLARKKRESPPGKPVASLNRQSPSTQGSQESLNSGKTKTKKGARSV